jgi:hypothetical protein
MEPSVSFCLLLLLLCCVSCEVVVEKTETEKDAVSVADEKTVKEIFKEWLANFDSIDALTKFSLSVKEKENFEGTLRTGKKFLKISDIDDFTFTGPLDDHQLPDGVGVLENEDVVVGSRDYCFRGKCQKSVVRVVGNFSAGLLNGVGEVYFSDGSIVRAEFRDSVLHGLAVEFDSVGRHRYTGRYSLGR